MTPEEEIAQLKIQLADALALVEHYKALDVRWFAQLNAIRDEFWKEGAQPHIEELKDAVKPLAVIVENQKVIEDAKK